MRVLVTGGAGYIGAVVALSLLEAGHDVLILDNLSNSVEETIWKIERLSGKNFQFIAGDLEDARLVDELFREQRIDGVLHLAGKKSVSESIQQPLQYYETNVTGTIHLLAAMQKYGVSYLVFSSSATVYGNAAISPIAEHAPRTSLSPYGQTKRVIEHFLEEMAHANPSLSIVMLRYFNPVGAHASGAIGEGSVTASDGLFVNLLSSLTEGKGVFQVYGGDYDTADGTCIRDFVHVEDLADAHLTALEYAMTTTGCEVFNIGSGKGHTILQVIQAFEAVTKQRIVYQMSPRRAGDIAVSYANIDKAKTILQWMPHKTLADMCRDAWRWHTNRDVTDDTTLEVAEILWKR